MLFAIAFFLLPLSTIVVLFIKDKAPRRTRLIKMLLLANTLAYFSPLIIARVATLPHGNMWSENGPGAILWVYLALIPGCWIVQVVLIVLKTMYGRRTP